MYKSNEARHKQWPENCKCACRLDAVFVMIKKAELMKNADVNIKNWLTNADVIKNILEILVLVNVNVINHVTIFRLWKL